VVAPPLSLLWLARGDVLGFRATPPYTVRRRRLVKTALAAVCSLPLLVVLLAGAVANRGERRVSPEEVSSWKAVLIYGLSGFQVIGSILLLCYGRGFRWILAAGVAVSALVMFFAVFVGICTAYGVGP
jgi:hypothetical protein